MEDIGIQDAPWVRLSKVDRDRAWEKCRRETCECRAGCVRADQTCRSAEAGLDLESPLLGSMTMIVDLLEAKSSVRHEFRRGIFLKKLDSVHGYFPID